MGTRPLAGLPRVWSCLLAGLLALGALPPRLQAAAARTRPTTEILFQGFPWDASVDGQEHRWYRHLEAKAPALARAGITHVWYPPVSRSVAPQGYMPGDLYDLGEDGNPTLYGTEAELRSSLAAFRQLGISTVLDAVLNHRCASHQQDGVWNVFHHASGKMLWERWALARGDYGGTGAPDRGEDFAPAPDVDHEQPRVRADLLEWLRWMRQDVGFDGVRLDFTKGYAARHAATYAGAFGDGFAVGEYWTSMGYDGSQLLPDQDAHRQQLADWVDGTGGKVASFDFTTKGLLQEAVRTRDYHWLRGSDGRAGGFLGWWPARAVTFVDNHDTGSTQGHWPFPRERVLEGYAYLLTHPGVPTVFWDHFFAWGAEHRQLLETLCQLRHEQGIHRQSRLEIRAAGPGLYAAEVDGRLALRLGERDWQPPEGWVERIRGPGFVIWTRPAPRAPRR